MPIDDEGGGQSSRLRDAAAFLILLVSLAFLTIQGIDTLLWESDAELDRAAWVLLAVAVYVIFGLRLPDILDRRKGDDE